MTTHNLSSTNFVLYKVNPTQQLVGTTLLHDQDRFERLLPRATRLVDVFTLHNRLFVVMAGALKVSSPDGKHAVVFTRKHAGRDGVTLGDVLGDGQSQCVVEVV
jgi:hypothetical protein